MPFIPTSPFKLTNYTLVPRALEARPTGTHVAIPCGSVKARMRERPHAISATYLSLTPRPLTGNKVILWIS